MPVAHPLTAEHVSPLHVAPPALVAPCSALMGSLYPKTSVTAQIGPFSVGQRAATVALRGSQFFAVGFLSSLLGHGLTVYLVRPPL